MAEQYNSLTLDNIKEFKNLIDDNRENFNVVLNNYKDNVDVIISTLNLINFDNWSDDVADIFSSYIESLKNGIALSLDNSVQQDGSVYKLIELINDLYDKCTLYIESVESFTTQDPNLVNVVSGFEYSSTITDPVFNETQLQEINNGLSSQRDVISGLLEEIKNLEFDDSVIFGLTTMPEISVTPANQDELVVNGEEEEDDEEEEEYVEEEQADEEDEEIQYHSSPSVTICQYDLVSVLMERTFSPDDDLLAEVKDIVSNFSLDTDFVRGYLNIEASLIERIYTEFDQIVIVLKDGSEIYYYNDGSLSRVNTSYDNCLEFLNKVLPESFSLDLDLNLDFSEIMGTNLDIHVSVDISNDELTVMLTDNLWITYDSEGKVKHLEGIPSSIFNKLSIRDSIDTSDVPIDIEYITLDRKEDGTYDILYVSNDRLDHSAGIVTNPGLITEQEYSYERREHHISLTINQNPICYNRVSSTPYEHKNMYYLGTDGYGYSYFAESYDPEAIVYKTRNFGNPASTSTAAALEYNEPIMDPDFVQSSTPGVLPPTGSSIFIITGGNQGNIKVKNIVTNGPNGAYTGASSFCTSVTFENGDYAPTIVQRYPLLSKGYDPESCFHFIDMNNLNTVSLSDARQELQNGNHPTIVINPGESINYHYYQYHIFPSDSSVQSNDGYPVYLVWDENTERYYQADYMGGYSTDDWTGSKYSYTVEDLLSDSATFNVK